MKRAEIEATAHMIITRLKSNPESAREWIIIARAAEQIAREARRTAAHIDDARSHVTDWALGELADEDLGRAGRAIVADGWAYDEQG